MPNDISDLERSDLIEKIWYHIARCRKEIVGSLKTIDDISGFFGRAGYTTGREILELINDAHISPSRLKNGEGELLDEFMELKGFAYSISAGKYVER